MCIHSLCETRQVLYHKKNVAVLLFKTEANLQLCVGDTVITARRLMEIVMSI